MATKKAPKKKPREYRDLKSLGEALGTKGEKKPAKPKPPAPAKGSTLQDPAETMVELRTLATSIRGLRHREDGLAGELKEVRARITTLLDQEQALILDADKGQTRLALAPPKKSDDAKAAATKAAHAPVTHPTLSTLLGGKRFVVTRTGEEYVGTVVGSEDRFGPHRSFRGAAEAVCGSLGHGPAAVRALQWEPYEANGKSAPLDGPAPDAPAKDATAESAAK